MINNNLINEKYLPNADAEKIVLHWTGGGGEANSDDRQHYHIIVNQDGRLVYGVHSIRDNDNTRDGKYAAHCYRNNTRCIGLSLAGMAGSRERPFDPGEYPITHAQYEIGCRVAAELCVRYKIDVVPKRVLNHGEVESILGIKQRQKWDVMVLPWNPSLDWEQVGGHFRNRVGYYWRELMGLNAPATVVQSDVAPRTEVARSQSPSMRYKVSARSGLNIRISPGTGSGKAGAALPYGTVVEALTNPDEREWTKIALSPVGATSSFVWVSSQYLQPVDMLPVG